MKKNYLGKLTQIKNFKLNPEVDKKLFGERFRYVKEYFEALGQEEIKVTEQDKYLYNLCRPERLMDLIYSFVLFDDGDKKITRYQQYFAVKKDPQSNQATQKR